MQYYGCDGYKMHFHGFARVVNDLLTSTQGQLHMTDMIIFLLYIFIMLAIV